MEQRLSLDDLSDVFNTMQDGVATLAAMIYKDLVSTDVLSIEDASQSLRRLSEQMRSGAHRSAIIGEGFARKFDDMALLFETARVQKMDG
jgi:hypothetical protein